MSEEEIMKKFNSILNNAKANWIYEDFEILLNFKDLYNKEKEKNKELEKQLKDIHSNFCKFNWKESNGKQVYNQLAELYKSIYKKGE